MLWDCRFKSLNLEKKTADWQQIKAWRSLHNLTIHRSNRLQPSGTVDHSILKVRKTNTSPIKSWDRKLREGQTKREVQEKFFLSAFQSFLQNQYPPTNQWVFAARAKEEVLQSFSRMFRFNGSFTSSIKRLQWVEGALCVSWTETMRRDNGC